MRLTALQLLCIQRIEQAALWKWTEATLEWGEKIRSKSCCSLRLLRDLEKCSLQQFSLEIVVVTVLCVWQSLISTSLAFSFHSDTELGAQVLVGSSGSKGGLWSVGLQDNQRDQPGEGTEPAPCLNGTGIQWCRTVSTSSSTLVLTWTKKKYEFCYFLEGKTVRTLERPMRCFSVLIFWCCPAPCLSFSQICVPKACVSHCLLILWSPFS